VPRGKERYTRRNLNPGVKKLREGIPGGSQDQNARNVHEGTKGLGDKTFGQRRNSRSPIKAQIGPQSAGNFYSQLEKNQLIVGIIVQDRSVYETKAQRLVLGEETQTRGGISAWLPVSAKLVECSYPWQESKKR